ncbi:MAG: AMP-binding protein, partial [Cyanobacteriota bacterium]|nr:AMP-binding protein [Cyanobacteriota bacterium]
ATGAGVNPGELKKKILKHFPGIFIVDVFGQTEMTPNTTIRIDTDSEKIKDRSVGKPIVQTRIIDEKGNDVKPGEIGEIIYNSPTIMKGYYKEPEKTAEVIKDGWFYSGDLGYFDEDGEIRVVERKKECISSGGEKIFPHEVEEILLTHPKVKEVCVIGVKDETWGSTVRAIIQLKEGEVTDEKEIIDWCRGNMAGYKKPKSVSFVDSFPVTPVGKIQRAKVKEIYGNP